MATVLSPSPSTLAELTDLHQPRPPWLVHLGLPDVGGGKLTVGDLGRSAAHPAAMGVGARGLDHPASQGLASRVGA